MCVWTPALYISRAGTRISCVCVFRTAAHTHTHTQAALERVISQNHFPVVLCGFEWCKSELEFGSRTEGRIWFILSLKHFTTLLFANPIPVIGKCLVWKYWTQDTWLGFHVLWGHFIDNDFYTPQYSLTLPITENVIKLSSINLKINHVSIVACCLGCYPLYLTIYYVNDVKTVLLWDPSVEKAPHCGGLLLRLFIK